MGFIDKAGDFVSDYWQIFLLLGLLLAWYVWRNLDFETKYTLRNIFSKKVLIIIALALTWYFWNKNGEIVTLSAANRWMPIAILLIWATYNFFGILRYETQKIVCANGFHGCYSQAPIRINGFLIFAIDSFSSGGISWDYATRILVLREETVQLFDRGAVSIAKPTFTSIYGLEEEVKRFIENDKYLKGAKGEVFYGWFDDIRQVDFDLKELQKLEEEKENPKNIYNMLKKELGVSNPTVQSLFWRYKNQCKATAKQTEVLNSVIEPIEEGVEHHRRIKDAYVGREEKIQRAEGGEEI